jgi:VanZ family protein
MNVINAPTVKQAKFWLIIQLLVLLVGTQIPGGWRDGIEHRFHAPAYFSSLAHFVLFAGLCVSASSRPLGWPFGRVLLAAFCLALLTEAMQLLAINRHSRWSDVLIDMAGALAGIGLSVWWAWYRRRQLPPQ